MDKNTNRKERYESMKKILAILMCAAMLLCIAPVGAVAADTEALPSGTAINSENGLGAITGSGDFYLAEDIYVDLTTATLPLIADGFTGTLDGNGHSIIFKDKTTGALKNTAQFPTNRACRAYKRWHKLP